MMRDKRLLLLLAGVVVISAILIVAGLMRPQTTTQPNAAGVDPSIPTAPTGPEAAISEPGDIVTEATDSGDFHITNFSVLTSTFNIGDALFIDGTVQDFAVRHNFSADGLELDKTSFKKNSDTQWGFMMRDAGGNQIFYVTVSRLPEGNVKVEEFLR